LWPELTRTRSRNANVGEESSDTADASIHTTNSVSVAVSNHLSLMASVKRLFESDPAFETGLDVDPPGSGGGSFLFC
jgi:hypothetical protein